MTKPALAPPDPLSVPGTAARASNLEWVRPPDNRRHAQRAGLLRTDEQHPAARLTDMQALDAIVSSSHGESHAISPCKPMRIRYTPWQPMKRTRQESPIFRYGFRI